MQFLRGVPNNALIWLTSAGVSITVQSVARDTGAQVARNEICTVVITPAIVRLTLVRVWREK